MINTNSPVGRCMICSLNRTELLISGLDVCLRCAYSRIKPVEPGFKIVIAVIPEGYDYEELKGGGE